MGPTEPPLAPPFKLDARMGLPPSLHEKRSRPLHHAPISVL